MRITSNPNREDKRKTYQDGTGLMNLVNPGEGQTGLFGYISPLLGIAGEVQMRNMPKLEAEALASDVDSKKRLLERAAVQPEVSRLGLENLQRNIERSQEEDASSLSTLIEQGMSPQDAANFVANRANQRDQQLTAALMQDDAQSNARALAQQQATDAAFANLEQSKLAAEQFDILGQKQADINSLFAFGTQAANIEGLINPQAADSNNDEKDKTRGAKLSERGYKHGGVTPGPHDHDVLNLIIMHEDGTPALDSDGDEMHVTGSEAIIPDYIFEELMAAAKSGDKNALFEIFMDEIATEKRFQV